MTYVDEGRTVAKALKHAERAWSWLGKIGVNEVTGEKAYDMPELNLGHLTDLRVQLSQFTDDLSKWLAKAILDMDRALGEESKKDDSAARKRKRRKASGGRKAGRAR
jgi:hypothetical protein